MIWKRNLRKWCKELWSGFIWLGSGSSSGPYYSRTCSYEWKRMWGERSGAFSSVRHLHVKGVFGQWSSGNHTRKEYTRTKAQASSFQGKADIVVSCG